ncbi:hypothetical protein PPERSA_02989 [Pseudocohnilembus persalinus]|uniref:Uncharacterized protein n=1 Tax=Pseudocohnilembus persalinus TaxID=266149 RepID=A0A0V0QET5_PSEPJ|nr:hypothetical protein PPERSA_02989 [Pseudocohnilembus persalinus]|eukprot:KRX00729.1 hypothetical protein PPERSA_02989 [Pseudocohnilembus persalinus]
MGTDRDKKKKKRRQVSSSSDSRRSVSSSRSERHTKKSRKNRKSERKQERSKSSSEENTNQNKKVKTNPQSVTNQQQGQQQFQPNFFMPMMGPGQMMKPYDPMFMGGQQGNMMGPMQTNFFKYNWGQQQMPYNPMLMQNMNLGMMDQKQSQPHAQQLLQKPMMSSLKQPLQPQQLQQQQVQQQPLQQQQSTQQNQQLQNQNIKPIVQQAPKNPLDPENFSVFKNRYIYPIVSEYLTNTQLNSKLCDQENILALCKKAFRDLQNKLEQQGGDKMLISQIDEFLEQLRNEEVEELIRQDQKLQNSKNEFQKVFQGYDGKEQDYTGYQILNEIQKDKSLFQILGTHKIENIFVNLNPTVKSFVNNLNSITDEEDLYQESLNLTSLSQQKIKVE